MTEKEDRKAYSRWLEAAVCAMNRIEETNERILSAEGGLEDIPDQAGLEERINAAIQKEQRREKRRCFQTISAKMRRSAAVIVLCLTVAGSLLIVNADAIKTHFYTLRIQDKSEYIQVNREKTSPIAGAVKCEFPGWENFYYPEFVPEGYAAALEACLNTEWDKIIVFEREDGGSIRFTQCIDNEIGLKLDSENAEVKHILVGSNPGVLTDKEGRISLTWIRGEMRFQITSALPLDEVIEMAESLIFIT